MADDDLSPFDLNEINLANYDLGEELGTGKLNHILHFFVKPVSVFIINTALFDYFCNLNI